MPIPVKSSRHFTPEAYREAVALRDKGMSYAVIAEFLGFERRTISGWLSKPGEFTFCFVCSGVSPRKTSCNAVCSKCATKTSLLKKLVFTHMNWTACWCCGETDYDFLVIGHPDDDGYLHRYNTGKQRLTGCRLLTKLIRDGLQSPYRLAPECCNCNFGDCAGKVGHKKLPRGGEIKIDGVKVKVSACSGS